MERLNALKQTDPVVFSLVMKEKNRQTDKLEMIASENFASQAVMEASSSILTNKYAEGYPGKRYYGGCEYVDVIERLAIERMLEVFGGEHANVQAHSGSQANMAVMFAMLKAGDKVVGMDLSNGGHLTHGSNVNFSGQLYDVRTYGVKSNGLIDYDRLEEIVLDFRPKMLIAGASAYTRVIDFARFRSIADKVGAFLLVDMAHYAGLIAAGLYPNPTAIADFVTTTTHKTLRGPRGGAIICKGKYKKAIDKAIFPGMQGGPLMHTIAAKAVCFLEASSADFKDYQIRVLENAKTLSKQLISKGFSVVSGGTDCHMVLVDLRNKGITGKEAELILDEVGITVNKNTVPDETESPFVTSGLRIGTAAITTRGLVADNIEEIVEIIDRAIGAKSDFEELANLKHKVLGITSKYPLYE